MTDITSLTSFLLFSLILELLSIFMVMINTSKIELINATENCLLNFSSVRNSFLPIELFLILPILVRRRSRGLDRIRTNILCNILCNEFLSTKLSSRKKLAILLLDKAIPSSFAINVW